MGYFNHIETDQQVLAGVNSPGNLSKDRGVAQTELAACIDATPEKISRHLPDGGHNSSYHHPTLLLYGVWNIVLFDGEALNADDLAGIRGLFDRFGRARNARGFPRQMLGDWMNTFSFAGPEGKSR